jgi:hypothetical protein
MKKLILDDPGAPRRGVALLASLGALMLAAWLAPFALSAWMEGLFSIWNVTAENVARAPQWIQWLYAVWPLLISFVQGAAVWALALILARVFRADLRLRGGFFPGLAASAALTLAAVALFCALDVMRFGYALTQPQMSGLSALLLAAAAAQAAGAVFATGLIGAIASGWSRAASLAAAAIFYALFFGKWTPLGLINGALFGLGLELMREKSGGVAPAAGFLMGFSALTTALIGFPARQIGAVYEFYPVSKPWLTGGDAGVWAGLFMTVALIGAILALALPIQKTKAAPPGRRAKSAPSERN